MINANRLQELLALARQHKQQESTGIVYNKEQQAFINLLSASKSCVLSGAAGTGKTTCTQAAITGLIQSGVVPQLQADDHKYLSSGHPGIIITAYTRRAVTNIRKILPKDLQPNCLTIHKLLEFQPTYYETQDPETGEYKTTMRFEPSRSQVNPLPTSIHTIIVEESSMLGTDLFSQLTDALTHKVNWVFIGDLNQLKPVFGSAILGFALNKLPAIELTQVYRQALESPIISLAHHILQNKDIMEFSHPSNSLTIHPWKKKIIPEMANKVLANFFQKAIESGNYDPEEDMILIPFNKGCGTVEINKYIANILARRRGAVTYEIIGGFNKHYLSVGDRVLYDKEDAEVISINPNMSYRGLRPTPASTTLDYWGTDTSLDAPELEEDLDFLLESMALGGEDRVKQCSHIITLKLLDSDTEVTIDTASEINNILLGYALTVHKAQGSEWRKVFCIFHHSHASMMCRELLYTAVTRAREELYIITEPSLGIPRQSIIGDTLQEKAEFFKGKVDNLSSVTFLGAITQ